MKDVPENVLVWRLISICYFIRHKETMLNMEFNKHQ